MMFVDLSRVSIFETAKAKGQEPYWHLRHLFEKLLCTQFDDELRALQGND